MEAVRTADGVILATPIYQGAYSGLLKTLLDLLPKYALAGKVVLPLATAGSDVHRLALDDALRPALGVLGADRVLASRVPLNQAPRDDNARGDDASHAGRLADLDVLDAAAAAFADALRHRAGG